MHLHLPCRSNAQQREAVPARLLSILLQINATGEHHKLPENTKKHKKTPEQSSSGAKKCYQKTPKNARARSSFAKKHQILQVVCQKTPQCAVRMPKTATEIHQNIFAGLPKSATEKHQKRQMKDHERAGAKKRQKTPQHAKKHQTSTR